MSPPEHKHSSKDLMSILASKLLSTVQILEMACLLGYVDVVEVLINAGHTNELTVEMLKTACHAGHIDVIEVLIEKGKIKPTVKMLETAHYHGKLNVIEALTKDGRLKPIKGMPYAAQDQGNLEVEVDPITNARKLLKLDSNNNLTQGQIRKAYWKMSRIYHPDKGGSNDAFYKLTEATELLIEETKRLASQNRIDTLTHGCVDTYCKELIELILNEMYSTVKEKVLDLNKIQLISDMRYLKGNDLQKLNTNKIINPDSPYDNCDEQSLITLLLLKGGVNLFFAEALIANFPGQHEVWNELKSAKNILLEKGLSDPEALNNIEEAKRSFALMELRKDLGELRSDWTENNYFRSNYIDKTHTGVHIRKKHSQVDAALLTLCFTNSVREKPDLEKIKTGLIALVDALDKSSTVVMKDPRTSKLLAMLSKVVGQQKYDETHRKRQLKTIIGELTLDSLAKYYSSRPISPSQSNSNVQTPEEQMHEPEAFDAAADDNHLSNFEAIEDGRVEPTAAMLKTAYHNNTNASDDRGNTILPLGTEKEYKHSVTSADKGRQHAFEISTTNFKNIKKIYQGMKGDHLKTSILTEFKEQIQKTTTTEELASLKEQLKASNEFKILKAGQGLFTKATGIETSSVKAFEAMFKEQEAKLSPPTTGSEYH